MKISELCGHLLELAQDFGDIDVMVAAGMDGEPRQLLDDEDLGISTEYKEGADYVLVIDPRSATLEEWRAARADRPFERPVLADTGLFEALKKLGNGVLQTK
jgi:hypothetical protein